MLGWLGEHEDPFINRRIKATKWNARYAYENAFFPEMLLYLIHAIPLRAQLIKAAEIACERSYSTVEKLGSIRMVVPWSEIYQAIWEKKKGSQARSGDRQRQQDSGKRKKQPKLSTEISVDSKGTAVDFCETNLAPDLPVDVPNLALSIRQPYVELILRGIKTIEYRPMKTNIRGRVYLYASLTPVEDVYEEIDAKPGDFPTGVIVGTVEIVDCTGYPGDFKWHLTRPKRLSQPIKPARHPQPSWFKPFENQK